LSRTESESTVQTKKKLFVIILSIVTGITGTAIMNYYYNYHQHFFNAVYTLISGRQQNPDTTAERPFLIDPQKETLKIEDFVAPHLLSSPTSMAFIDSKNLLVLEKDGQIRLVSNGILQKTPVLTEPVDNASERGLLGIAILKEDNGFFNKSVIAATKKNSHTPIDTRTPKATKVFLYFTESNGGKEQLRNRIYRYDWDSNKHLLLNPKVILDVSALPGPNHNGGKLAIGPDHYLYAVIGNVNAGDSILQNDKRGGGPHDTSVIFRINPNNGSPAANNPLSISDDNGTTNKVLSKYYAYGIRNSFGIAFDPITGRLWDTENGELAYDEINLVTPGFNSGWQEVMGPISRSNITTRDLVNLPGSHYADPVFSWLTTIGVTDIEFLKSTKLGSKYTNNIFVGDINNGNLYYFELNKNRTGLGFGYNSDYDNTEAALLSDFVADDKAEVSTITFGKGFGGITDIKTSPDDGFLYILSYFNGCIYRIVPNRS
jgi:glucose/arabinose dehydrogenase